MMAEATSKEYTFRKEYESNPELLAYGCSSLSLFTLGYYLNIEDIAYFASDAITEGGNDKKIDICYVDLESKRIIIAQDYISEKWDRESAPANKASDLNTAISWLLSASEINIPLGLKDKAIEIRNAIKGGEIEQIEVLYIHNCQEHINIAKELNTVLDSLDSQLLPLTKGDNSGIQISCRELGLNGIESIYKSRKTQILIDDWIEIPSTNNYLIEKTSEWNSIMTTVPAHWIKDLFNTHKNNLFSANYRDYLGSLDKEDNINNQIVHTATDEPENFWVFNNGITALTFELDFENTIKKIRGISIINGAQTSGALGSAPDTSVDNAKVLIRFVECKDPNLIDRIILYNNTQNAINPEDKRSKDSIQQRIHEDFSKYKIDYYYRRSETKKSKYTITGKSIASPLCAFHGDPQTSYRNPKRIFKDDEVYNSVFRNDISAEHIFLINSLSNSIDKIKNELKKKVAFGTATAQEENQYKVLKYTASKHFLIFLVGFVIEEIINTKITDSFQIKCKESVISVDNRSLLNAWGEVVKTILPFIASNIEGKGPDAFYEVPRSDKLTKRVSSELKTLLSSLETTLSPQFGNLRKRITL